MAKTPNFDQRSELTHYIDEDQRMSGRRPAVAAFLPNVEDDHLSANSLELERLDEIADYYREIFQDGEDDVALTVHKIADYNTCGNFAGAQIAYSRSTKRWEYQSPSGTREAYRHRPVRSRGSYSGSPSHCGVEFMDAIDQRKFSRRIANKKRFLLR